MLNSLFVPSAPVVPLGQLALIPPSWVTLLARYQPA